MVKKLVIMSFAIALMPVSSAFGFDNELFEIENELDAEAAQIMSRRGGGERGRRHDRDKGEEIVKGVIDLIGDLAGRNGRGHGRGGRHPGYGRQPRRVECVAQNAHGRRFKADGFVVQRVQRRALNTCFEMTRRHRVKRTCHIVTCRAARW